ncbi:MAG: RNA-binding transcriptional accessory protein [Clostridia bacterium]|nr:RNA-binding transcriptional accessory protein [Clostridia bacterium]
MNILQTLTNEFNLNEKHTENIVKLLDDGNTVPFIARYRKEMTGSCDDVVLRALSDRLEYLRSLEKRKGEVTSLITEQGKMTEEIAQAIEKAATLTEVEDIYRPYKQKRKTRASVAIANGLEPLADKIMEQVPAFSPRAEAENYINEQVKTVEEALQGAQDIIAERVSDDASTRKKLRNFFFKFGEIYSCYDQKTKDGDELKTYEMYDDRSEPVVQIKGHRVLAITRGEKEGFLKVSVKVDDEIAKRITAAGFVKGDSESSAIVRAAAQDAFTRLIAPSVEREVRADLFEAASEEAIKMFELNLKPLLMQPPVKDKITMGWDPGFRTGCKICVVDGTGKLLDKSVVFPTTSEARKEESKVVLKKLIAKHGVEVISCGNGTASRESEAVIEELVEEIERETGRKVGYVIVNEAGASVYSASEAGTKEFPDLDVTTRSAVSIARRLQDPLAELIKIDPKSIGVGQYQHDMNQKRLDGALAGVLEDCVNSVGVDLNTASVALLTYVAGLNAGVAKNIVEYREANGKFTSRKQLLKVPKLGEKAYNQCAGFLRVDCGANVFDNTAVHPESYEKAERLLSLFSYTKADVKERKIGDLRERVKAYGAKKVEEETGLDGATLADVITELMKPGRDVRDSLPAPILFKEVREMKDLKPGMELRGTVRNVATFGAFVDIGVHQDGLVHISELSDKGFVKNVSDVVSVGQVVTVWVKDVDLNKKRIALTMKSPK